MAKRMREPETGSLFNKNVMLGLGVTHSIHCSVLSVYFIVVVAFSSCLVIALQKKRDSASSNKSSGLLHHSLCVLF